MKTNDYKQESAIQLLFEQKFIGAQREQDEFSSLDRAEMRQIKFGLRKRQLWVAVQFFEMFRNARSGDPASQATKFAESLMRGEPNRKEIVATMVADKVRELV